MNHSDVGEVSRAEGYDLETFADAMRAWKLVIRQLAPGKSHWTVDAIRLGPVRLYRGSFSRRTLLIGTTPAGSATIVCPRSAQSCIDYCGEQLHFGCIGFALPGSAIQIVFPDAIEYLVLQLPVSVLERVSPTPIQAATRQPSHHLAIEASRGASFIRAVDGVIDQYLTRTDLVAHKSGCRATEREVTDRLIALILHGRKTSVPSLRAAYNEVLNRALNVVHPLHEPLPLHELASACCVGPRTLQRIFRERLRLTPQKYQRWNRMHGLRRDLLAAHRRTSTVTEIAGRWGFTDFGRLAGEYRQLFGELPRATLMSDQGQSSRHVVRVAQGDVGRGRHVFPNPDTLCELGGPVTHFG